ncbi:hypothetical protein BJX76DRAFT_332206 [Aspergillus varians]
MYDTSRALSNTSNGEMNRETRHTAIVNAILSLYKMAFCVYFVVCWVLSVELP